MNDTLVQSVRKAMNIMDIVIFEDLERKGVGLFEMAKKLDLRPNTLHNLLKTLVACGYVEQNESSKYLAGPKCADIGMLNKLSTQGVHSEFEEALRELGKEIEETVVFVILSNGVRIPTFKIEHDNAIKIDMSAIEGEHIYEKPTGRILTAYADEYSFSVIKDKWGYPGALWNSIENDEDFQKARKEVRLKGSNISFTDNGDIIGIAVPVLNSVGKLVGSIGTYAPRFRCDKDKIEQILKSLLKTAELIQKRIYTTPLL